MYKMTKKRLYVLARDLLEEIRENYFMISKDQLYYLLVKTKSIQNTAEVYNNFVQALNDALRYGESWPWRLCDCGPKTEGMPFFQRPSKPPKEYLRERLAEDLLTLPVLNRWEGQEYFVKLIVNSMTLHECLTSSSDVIKQVEVDCAAEYAKANYLYTEWHRFFEMTNENHSKIIILYLGDFDPKGWRMFEIFKKHFNEIVHGMDYVGITPDQTKTLIPSPLITKDSLDNKSFNDLKAQNQIEHNYQLESLDPWDLVMLVENAINKYYNQDLYPSEKEAEWIKVYKEVKRPFIKIVDRVLGFQKE